MNDFETRTVCFFNSNKAWGGGEKWHFSMAQELKKKGLKTLIVTNFKSTLRTTAEKNQLNVYPFRIGNLSFLNPIKVLLLCLFFKTKKVDVVIMNLPSDLKLAGLAAKLAGVKKIIYRRGMPHPLRSTKLNQFLFRRILTNVIVNSLEIQKTLVKNNESWFPTEKIELLYNGVHLEEEIHQSEMIKDNDGDEIIIGSAGRLTPQKGQIYLLELAKILKQKKIKFKLLIAGEGELRTSLTAKINDFDLKHEVILLGHVEKIDGFMKQLDLFIFPSLFEGSANTLIETLFYGKPIIAFNVSSNPEIIQHNFNGLLAEAFNINDLVSKTIELIDSKEKRDLLVTNGKHVLREKFDNKKIISQLENIIN